MRALGLALGLFALASPASAGGRVLAPMDVVSIRIPQAPDLDLSARIAPDGTLAFPYIGRVKAAGLTEDAVAAIIERRLVERKIIAAP
jgi:protein involved in polysaccharide export with SLBB domain